jgi:hypothetical protein
MIIRCPTCNREIPASDIDLLGKTAKCIGCNNVFEYSAQLPASSSETKERLPLDKPKNFEIERSNGEFTIVRKWFNPSVIFLTIFCLFWNSFMVSWYIMAFKQQIYVMAMVGLLHGAFGLGLIYVVLAGYLNKTYIKISFDSLSIRHRPFPWMGQKTLKKADLKQLYSKKHISHGKHGSHYYTYSVQALAQRNHVIELLSGLTTREEALFIEQEVEKYLRIDDERVDGEISR